MLNVDLLLLLHSRLYESLLIFVDVRIFLTSFITYINIYYFSIVLLYIITIFSNQNYK